MGIAAWIGRAVAGGVAGAVVFVVALGTAAALSWYPPEAVGPPLFLAVAGAGMAAGAALGAALGGREIRGGVKAVAVGTLAGCLLGVLGAFAYSYALTGGSIRGKMADQHRFIGLMTAVPAGTILGGLCGLLVGFLGPVRRGRESLPPTQETPREQGVGTRRPGDLRGPLA
jgi:hypothetical protein